MFSNEHVRRRRTALLQAARTNLRGAPFSPTECSGSSTGAFLESSGAPALRSTESIPYAGHRSYIDLTNAGSGRDLSWIMAPTPFAPCHRVTRGVEIPTTVARGSDRRHWLKLTRPPPRTTAPLASVPRTPGPAHHSQWPRPASTSRELEPSQEPASRSGGERMTPRLVRRETSGWSPLAGEPLLRARGSGRVGPDSMISSASGLPR